MPAASILSRPRSIDMRGRFVWKAGAVSILVHGVILTFVWVGFSVPLPRADIGFYYTGSFLPENEVHASAPADRVVDRAAADPYPAAFFTSWIGMRNVDKPR